MVPVLSVFVSHTHTHTHNTFFFTEKDYAQAQEMRCSAVQKESSTTCKGVYVCVCLYDSNTHNSTEVQMVLNVLSPSSLPSMREFSQKMVENLFNYASSFAVDPRQSPLAPGETYIPSSTLRDWYNTFQRRLAANPNFWKISVVLRMSVVCAVFFTYTMQVVILWSKEQCHCSIDQ